MNFTQRIERRRARYFADMSAEEIDHVTAADKIMEDLFDHDWAIQAGDEAPDFDLPVAGGGRTSLRSVCGNGPVVISFYRGHWCPFCSLEIAALAQVHGELERQGGTLLAISPQPEDSALKARREYGIDFPLLVDREARVCEAYGLVCELPEGVRQMSLDAGFEPIARTGLSQWAIPVPATYVVGQDREVRYSFLDTNYRNRLDPAELGKILSRMRSPAETGEPI